MNFSLVVVYFELALVLFSGLASSIGREARKRGPLYCHSTSMLSRHGLSTVGQPPRTCGFFACFMLDDGDYIQGSSGLLCGVAVRW